MAIDVKTKLLAVKKRLGIMEAVFLSVGGQGSTTGMNVLTRALAREGKKFTVMLYARGTTRGGPTQHTLRIANSTDVLPRSRITIPDCVVLFDERKITVKDPGTEDILLAFTNGLLIVVSDREPAAWKYPYTFEGEAISVNSAEVQRLAEISNPELKPSPRGFALFSVFAGATGVVSLASLEEATKEYFSTHGLHRFKADILVKANLQVLREGYEMGKTAKRVKIKGTGQRTKTYKYEGLEDLESWFGPPIPLPTYESGNNPNIWRDEVPALDDAKCIRCDLCYSWISCPDGNWHIIKPGKRGKAYDIQLSLSYCKGCHACVSVCPAGAVTMKRDVTAERPAF